MISGDMVTISTCYLNGVGTSQVPGTTRLPIVPRETRKSPPNPIYWKENVMKLNTMIQQAGATGYILLWLLGIPIPILLLIFLLRGCT